MKACMSFWRYQPRACLLDPVVNQVVQEDQHSTNASNSESQSRCFSGAALIPVSRESVIDEQAD